MIVVKTLQEAKGEDNVQKASEKGYVKWKKEGMYFTDKQQQLTIFRM